MGKAVLTRIFLANSVWATIFQAKIISAISFSA
jgi:hypothetical protein